MTSQRRHPALIPLSHDHHHGLVAAQRLKRGEPAYRDVESVAESILRLWTTELRPHFEQEERVLFTLELTPSVRALVDRALDEHRQMKELVEECSGSPEAAGTLGTLLEAHIRFEERELFPALQKELSEEQMEQVGRDVERMREET